MLNAEQKERNPPGFLLNINAASVFMLSMDYRDDHHFICRKNRVFFKARPFKDLDVVHRSYGFG